MKSWYNDTGELPDLVGTDYEIPLLGAFLFYFVQVYQSINQQVIHYIDLIQNLLD